MSRDEGAGAGSVLLAFLIGAVSGAALALLYAPTTGDETRKYLRERAKEGRDRATDAYEKGREAVKDSRDALTQAFERGKEAYQQARRETV